MQLGRPMLLVRKRRNKIGSQGTAENHEAGMQEADGRWRKTEVRKQAGAEIQEG
jgi:hypothetical protein